MNNFSLRFLMLVLMPLSILGGAVQAQPNVVPEAVASESGDCAFEIPPTETLGTTLLCGQILVPQDWQDPDGSLVTLSYAVLKSSSVAPFPDPVLYFEGGPGGTALGGLGSKSGSMSGIRDHRDVVMWDQRGTTYSSGLFCPDSVQVSDPESYDEREGELQARFDALEIDAYSDPEAVRQIAVEDAQLADRSRCVPYLEEQGIDLAQFTTENTVLDAIALMDHLGYPAYNLYGISYGSTVVLAILDHYSDRPEAGFPPIRSSVIEGIAPRNRSWVEMAYEQVWVMLRIFSQCEEDPACVAAYPDIRRRAVELTAALRSAPLARDDGGEVTLEEVLGILRSATSTASMRPFLPRLIAELERGESATLDVLLAAASYRITLPELPTTAAEGSPAGGFNAQLTQLDEQLDAIKDQFSLLLFTQSILSEAAIDAETQPELFFAILEGYMDRIASARSLLLDALHGPNLHPEQRTRGTLTALVTRAVFLPALQQELVTLAERMTEEEIADVFARMARSAFQRELVSIASITNRVVNCGYFGNTMFNEVAFATFPEFEAPHLIGPEAFWIANYQVSCEQLGLAADAFSPPPPPAISDVRTLVLNGAVDANTPVEYAERAMEGLSNAALIVVPEVSHAFSILGDECGRALVAAFFLSPDETSDRGCVEAKRIAFVSPEQELPPLP